MRLVGNQEGRDRGAPWKPAALEEGRNEAGSWWVRWDTPRPKGSGSFATRRVGRGQSGCQANKAVAASAYWGGLPKLETRTGRAVVDVEGHWVVVVVMVREVREQVPAFVGLGTKIPCRS